MSPERTPGAAGAVPEDAELGARIARVQSRAVMICTPIARAPVWQYTLALAETCVLLERLGVRFLYASVVGSSNLARARNVLAAKFLASVATDLMFIDDDIAWRPNDLVRLLASEEPLVAGVGRKKVDKPNTDPDVWCCQFKPGSARGLDSDAMGNVEVARVGTGFMRIDRRVFAAMIAAHPEWKRRGAPEMPAAEKESYYRFFAFGEDEELGEDYVFCDRWTALGGKIWIDPSLRLSHVGEKAYTGAIMDLMHVVAPAPVLEAAE